jgi:hypothetical protein
MSVRLQKIKFEILAYVAAHPEINQSDICAKFKCSKAWLKTLCYSAGIRRARGWPSFSVAHRISVLDKKRSRIQAQLDAINADIRKLENARASN